MKPVRTSRPVAQAKGTKSQPYRNTPHALIQGW